MIDRNLLTQLISAIHFDKDYLEATFQFKLLLQLAKHFDEDKIWPERNIATFGLSKKGFAKKKIDIVCETKQGITAIELKMPMNGQVPEQMFKFVEDIEFLEQLKRSGKFAQAFLIAVTKDHLFWEGRRTNGIYAYFRGKKPRALTGKVHRPTGSKQKKYKVQGKYVVQWVPLPNGFRYFIVEVQ
jgi:hypothetical protein